MKIFRLLAIFSILLAATSVSAKTRNKSGGHSKSATAGHAQPNPAEIEAATRLQIFLDRANFSPGAIDGHYGEFTLKALAFYRQSRGEQPSPPPAKPATAPDITGLDVASIGSPFIPYSVTDGDLKNVGTLPSAATARAKLKSLPYASAAEAIAEKFHCDVHFLEKLNPGKTKTIKVGDQLNVPNVEPFELAAVKDLKVGSEIAAMAANDIPDESDGPDEKEKPAPPATAQVSVKVDMKTNMLGVFDANKMVAAYPVTVGSAQTASPVGEWKVRGVAKLPPFRYDEQMLKHGQRSAKFQMLPPGPNNPVGVVWIALNKKGIGLHGTETPETIGRASSHGCIRLANWDIVRLAEKVKSGVPVSIH